MTSEIPQAKTLIFISLPLLDVTGRKTTVVSETTDLHMNSLVHVIGKGSEDVGKLGHSLADFFPEEVQH